MKRAIEWIDDITFKDDYDAVCSLQPSSSCEPRIWLGVDDPKPIIRYRDAKKAGMDLKKKSPETNEYGWCDYPLADGTFIPSRMHLNRAQALELGKMLVMFGKTGRVK